jgi:PAS domain S-box-containing protein
MARVSSLRNRRLGAECCGAVLIGTLLASVASPAEPVRLQLKWRHQFQFAGYYAALERGYYKEQGLDVEILEGGAKSPSLPTVLGGGAEFGVSDAEVLLARLRGDPVVACAAIFQHSPYVLLSRRDRGIRSPADLVGARVMLSDDQGAAQFRAMLVREGVDPARVAVVRQSWNLDDLVEGRIDAVSAYATVEPAQLRARGVEPSLLRATDYGVDFYGDTLFTTEERARTRPQQVAAFVAASLKGWAYALEHPEEIADRILTMPGVAERGLTREALLQEAREMRPFILPDVVEIGHMNEGRWLVIAKAFAETGLAASTARADGLIYGPRPGGDPSQRRRFLLLALAALAAAAAALVWNVQMRRSVRERTRELRREAAQRLQAESDLRASEERLRLTFEGAATGITVTAPDGRFVYANPAYKALLGYSDEELLGMPFDQVTHPEDVAASHEARDRLLTGGANVVVLEKRYLHRSGDILWVRLSISLTRSADGTPRQFVVVTEDVSERKAAEALLQCQRQALEMISLGAPLSDTLGTLVRGVEAQSAEVLASILLLDRDGLRLRHCVAPRLSATFTQAIDGEPIGERAGSCGTAAYRGEAVVVDDIEADPLWAAYRGLARAEGLRACWSTPIFDAEHKVLGTFALYFRKPGRPSERHLRVIDMATQTAAIAISRKREEEALRESRRRLLSIYDTVGDVVFVVRVEPDGGFRFESVNKRFSETTGVPADAVVGKRVEEVIPPASLHLVLERYRQAVRDRDVVRWEETSDYPVGRLTGEVSVAPVLDEDTSCERLVGAVHDVTARKRAEERHAQAEEMLRQSQKLESIGRLAGGVAHDFNNILGVILGYSELMYAHIGLDHPARPRLEQVIKAAHRAAGLTRQLLAFSRKQVMQPKLLDLGAVVNDLKRMLDRLVGEDLEIDVRGTGGLGAVQADPTQMEQVVMNLVVNARDAMPEGGRLGIELANVDFDEAEAAAHPPARPGRFVRLSVSDTGTGMDADTQRRIFEPFFTTKAPGEGTGLGLATVYGIVSQLGGFIVVKSALGQGTTFEVHLPRLEEVVAVRPSETAPAPTRGHETVLLVEDSASLRDLTCELLTEQGYEVLTATQGEEALALVRDCAHGVDIVLTDVVMPRLGGGDLVRRLHGLNPGMRVVYMSGYADGTLSRQGLIEQDAVLLEKPFTAERLSQAIRRALDKPRPASGSSA